MKLRLILSDQLNINHSWFESVSDDVLYVMMETRHEMEFIRLHRQKQLGILANMRDFFNEIRSNGHNIHYIYLDDPENEQQLDWNLLRILSEHSITEFEFQEADEYSTHALMQQFVSGLDIPYREVSSEHFFTEKDELGKFFAGKKKILMEHFYRHMRKKHQILVDGNEDPLGGKWNYDGQNRERFPDDMPVPEPYVFHHDLTTINEMLDKMEVKSMGHVNQKDFIWPVGRAEALELLNHFLQHLLPHFGTYQDAMTTRGWTLFHSRVSFALNRKLVSPKEVVQAALDAYQNDASLTLPQVEGFIRQIIGWREYMRGVYWNQMPEYATKNHFFADRPLPAFYWTGKTEMNCLRHVITQSLDYGWTHHIQRLMIPGNFAMLIGADPDQVDDWFLGMYHDAVQWVEMPNVRGMSQFADGGIVGTKPYAVSANYINNMSDYCQSCVYDKDKKVGKDACPFNALYWHFYHRNRKRLAWYPRLNQIFAIWDRMPKDRRTAYLKQAEDFLKELK
ncbi:MAG: cryptochrome/photolyase family protein [Bacteroidota bacterium]|nr:cryptochrome/photolyase family protein [Bacteroidota bacterium]